MADKDNGVAELLADVAELERGLGALLAADLTTPGAAGDQATVRWLLAGPDHVMRRMRFFARPRLLVPGVIEALRAAQEANASAAGTGAANQGGADQRPPVASLLDFAAAQRDAAERDPVSLPVAGGPVERLWNDLGTLKASQAQVCARAAAPVVTSTLSVPYVRALTEFAWRMAEAGTPGLTMARLLLAATEPGAEQAGIGGTLRCWAAVAFMDVARRLLQAGPDGPLFAEATGYGEQVLPLARRDAGDTAATVLLSLGQLALDPYTPDRDVESYPQAIGEWLEHEGDHGPGEPRMPAAPDALARAEGWLRECAGVAEGRQRGFARRALASALLCQGELGTATDQAEIAGLLRDAVTELDPARDGSDIAAARATLRRLGADGDPAGGGNGNPDQAAAADTPIVDCPLDELERRYGAHRAAEMVHAEAGRLQPLDPVRALALVTEAAPLRGRAGPGPRRGGLQDEIRLIAAAYDAEPPELPGSPGSPKPAGWVAGQAEQVLARADHEGWDPVRRAAALIGLAAVSGRTDEETTGLRLLQQARDLAPSFTADHAQALEYVRAVLLMGAGVNAFEAGDGNAANAGYSAAIAIVLGLDLPDLATELLQRVRDVVTRAAGPGPGAGPGTGFADGIEAAVALATQLAPEASRLEARLGSTAADELQKAYKEALAAMTGHPVPPDPPLALLQLAKGRRFAAVLSAGSRYRPDRDPRGLALLDAIADARKKVPGQQPEVTALAEEVIVAAYASVGTAQDAGAGDTDPSDEAYLAGLEQQYDAHVSEQLLLSAGPGTGPDAGPDTGPGAAPVFTLRDLQAMLPGDTVLLDFFAGRDQAGQLVVYVFPVTSGEPLSVAKINEQIPDSDLLVPDHGSRLRLSPLGLVTAGVRQGVQEVPLGRRPVIREAETDLDDLFDRLLGHVGSQLDRYRQTGKRHLCLIPNGPLHYLPMHLLGPPGRPLAADWAVTYLPTPQLLAAAPAGPAPLPPRSRRVAAIALGFADGGPDGTLPPLDGAVPEAEQVAALFGEQPILETAATPAAVMDALRDAAMVHIATHGGYDAYAPAFQALYLQPDNKHPDGRLYAHELLGSDLRGLDLVTLSACQTALGRFDVSGNLRGLPASLLLAGAATVIGTLWPVRDVVARAFFHTLYTSLRDGAAKLDGFTAAQASVRQQFPQYRDWGCFIYTGRT